MIVVCNYLFEGKMENSVFILGAGASAQAKVPLMKDFVDEADRLYQLDKVLDKKSFKKVLYAIKQLQQANSKSIIDLVNIESILSAFEMAKLLNVFFGYSSDEIDELVESAKNVIAETIRGSMICTHENDFQPPPYQKLAELIRFMISHAQPTHNISIITFNYDIAVELCLKRNNIDFNYSLSDKLQGNGINLLKLHGSLNWTKCSECETIVPFTKYLIPCTQNIGRDKIKTDLLHFEVLRANDTDCTHKNDYNPNIVNKPVIIPPVINKTFYYNELFNVWRKAALDLQKAENIFVIGYSLPDTDYFFKYLYALGTASETLFKRFWVFDPDKSVEERFRRLLGNTAKQRFEYIQQRFEQSINIIKKRIL